MTTAGMTHLLPPLPVLTEGSVAYRYWLVDTNAEALRDWLRRRTEGYGLTWLLAHTEAGVIWGIRHGATLDLSSDAYPQRQPPFTLDWATLHQARLFSQAGELRLWPTATGAGQAWRAALVAEALAPPLPLPAPIAGDPTPDPAADPDPLAASAEISPRRGWWYDEPHLLWGTQAIGTRIGRFWLVREEEQIIRHAPPIEQAPAAHRRAALLVRHHVTTDAAGVARIADSRLVALLQPGAGLPQLGERS